MNFWLNKNIQNPLNKVCSFIDYLLDLTLLVIWCISIFVLGLLYNVYESNYIAKKYKELPNLELFWTFFPSIILIYIAIPSIYALYFLESKKNQSLNFKITGHQWYWNYDYFNKFNFDSYLESKNLTNFRLLETDNHFVIPMGEMLFIVTSEDVLHSWSVPSMSIKMDANPGRLNSNLVDVSTPGMFYGHCSEICGANHTFMPIALESVSFLMFKNWFNKMLLS